MFKNVSNLGSVLNKQEQKKIKGSGARLEICNAVGEPVICKTGQCFQNSNGTWSCKQYWQ
jgi:hypothetical protein